MESLKEFINLGTGGVIAVLLIKLLWNDMKHLENLIEQMTYQVKAMADDLREINKKLDKK